MGDKVIRLKNGLVESVSLNADPLPVERIEW
jgi:putative ABC transport system ATP-binding protein